jgi:ABC-type antimicrobial peptide transport system permease subunit
MIKNYFKTAWRNLARNKAFSTINILGLALGMACSLLIMLWIQDERSVDGFHVNGKQLYQVYERNFFDGKIEAGYPTQALLAEELTRIIPEIENASSLEWNTTNTFEAGEKINKMEGSFAGEDFFAMFSYPLIQGSAKSALNTLNSIAISRNMAEHFFGSPEKAIGKSIRYENYDNLKVTAVFENLPANSSQHFDFLRSWLAFKKENNSWIDNWGNTDAPTFIQLQENANPTTVESKIKDFVYRYKERSKGFKIELALQPYTEKYLHSTFKNGQVAGGRIEYIRLFTMIAIFILLIACINFMNLATARSVKRAKEVGIRKVVGAARFTLIGQFIGEAMLLTFLSFIIAFAIAIAILPVFNDLTGKQLMLPAWKNIFWIRLIGLLITVGFVAGSYPALFLSSLKPIRVLKGSLKFNWTTTFFRKGLVAFQFALSIIMITGMIVIYRQLNYMQTKNIGYDRENLLYIPLEGELSTKYSTFKEEATRLPGIKEISKIRAAPTMIGNHTGDIKWVGKDPNLVTSFVNTTVGYDFVKTMNLKLAEGRDFSKEYGTDSASFIINETAVAKIGYKDPVGKQIWWGNREGRIVGVLKDFHFASLHASIEPLIIRLDENRQWGTMLVRIENGKTKEGLVGLEKIYKTLNPKFPFTYQFSDLEFVKLYRSEQLVSKLSRYFAFLAIFISCLGLFGFATFAAGQRTKEISIRKVLGASVANILGLLSSNLMKPVIIAILIACPIAWYVMNNWLEDFAYKIMIGWWVFAIAGLITVGIALLTISFQVIKAAISTPVKSLRTE